jgi:hypothetical protein
MIKLSEISLSFATKKQSKILVFTLGCCLASGCSMIDQYAESKMQSVIGQQMEQFTKLEPEVQRVLALESDMQIIIGELGKYSNLGTDPLGNDEDTVDGQVQTDKGIEPSQNSTNEYLTLNRCGQNSKVVSSHCNKQVGIHLAAFSDSKYVLPGWLYLKNQLPVALQVKLPLKTEIHKQDTTYYSLRLGPFTSVTKAKKICDGLGLQISCSVTEYYGRPLDSGV